MHDQELFETISKHLFKQGCRSMKMTDIGASMCCYRGPNETSCAVGCVMPDELYDPTFENDTITGLVLKYPQVSSYFNDHVDLLSKLQSVHDCVSSWGTSETMRRKLANAGSALRLDTKFLSDFSFSDR